jgi:hypothetical protein
MRGISPAAKILGRYYGSYKKNMELKALSRNGAYLSGILHSACGAHIILLFGATFRCFHTMVAMQVLMPTIAVDARNLFSLLSAIK